MSTSPQTQKENHLYKVLVIGDYAVGKTSIIKRYCEGYFTPNYKLTIGVDFAVKSLEIENKNVSLQLWDVAGHERFGTMTRVYYKYAIAALVVFDLTRPATFEAVLKWRDDVNSKVILANDQPIPLVLLANKCDLEDVHVNKEELDLFCQQNGFLKWFETSALSDIGIDSAMKYLALKILEVAKNNKPQLPPETLLLGTGNAMESETQKVQQQRMQAQKQEQNPTSECCQ
eukprot:TRINITY_DN4302_c0_g1_i11.p1 TRINITY_DN4302_c0_g1~~TRINITY_DN4302_c0_g1_i11.p1  ORF type:complete len:230 (-),score=35.93 TRINITY_DN4302_c0_g1_i11:44-733(-)